MMIADAAVSAKPSAAKSFYGSLATGGNWAINLLTEVSRQVSEPRQALVAVMKNIERGAPQSMNRSDIYLLATRLSTTVSNSNQLQKMASELKVPVAVLAHRLTQAADALNHLAPNYLPKATK
jgi:hypothetical protein